MVKRTAYFILAGYLLSPSAYSEGQETYEEFRQRVEAAQQKIDYSQQLLKLDELHNYIPDAEGSAPPEKNDPVSLPVEADSPDPGGVHRSQAGDASKHAAPASHKPSRDIGENHSELKDPDRTPRSTPARSRSEASDAYIAPSLRQASAGKTIRNVATIDQPETKSIVFGIRIGTEMEVELLGGATNVQNGLMKFRVTRTVTGDKRALPLNTLLFARPSAVLGSPRLFTSQRMKGITPDGKEFALMASVRASDSQPGLLAYVVNDGKTLYRAASEGESALAGSLLSLVPEGVIVDAGKAAANQVLREQQGESRAKYGSGVYVVQANPQPAIIEIEETF